MPGRNVVAGALAAALVALIGCRPPQVYNPGASGSGGTGGIAGSAGASAPAGRTGSPDFNAPDAGSAVAPPVTASCATQSNRAERLPVDLALLVDTSGSMGDASGDDTKWNKAKAALSAFVRDPASAGLGVGITFFPGDPGAPAGHTGACATDADCAGISVPLDGSCRRDGVCYSPGHPVIDRLCAVGLVSPFNCPAGLTCRPRGICGPGGAICAEGSTDICAGGAACQVEMGTCRRQEARCTVAAFGKLDVDIGDLPGRADAIVAALNAHMPDGSTPMTLGLDSAYTALIGRARANPGRRMAVILATDGLPACGLAETVTSATDRIARALAEAPSIATYAVGVFSDDGVAEGQAALQRFAAAGGTKDPFILATGADLNQRLLEALQQIRGQVVACDYGIPPPRNGAALDFGKVNVRATAQGVPADLGYVASADRCPADKGGWYYQPALSSATTPTRVVLCPATCDRLKADPAAEVDLDCGCATRTIN
jgi:hypothetical protein